MIRKQRNLTLSREFAYVDTSRMSQYVETVSWDKVASLVYLPTFVSVTGINHTVKGQARAMIV